MKHPALISTLVLLFVTPPAASLAAETAEDLAARCRQYAVEDEVPQEEIDSYIRECVESLSDSGSDEGETGPAASD